MTLASDPVFDLDEAEFDVDEEPRTLSTIDEADRYGWIRSHVADDMREMEQLYDDRLRQIRERRDEVLGTMQRRLDWLDRSLEGWTRAHYAETGTKSVKLPSVTVSLRKTPDKIEPVDKEPPEDAREGFVRVKREWDRNAIKEATNPGPVDEDYDAPEGFVAHVAVDRDGLVVPGVVWLLRTAPSFSVKAAT